MTVNETRIIRTTVESFERLLGERFSVLDDGFVRVVDYMGSDDAIVQAARISYGQGTRQVHEDRGLIRYLMRHRHTTPFEMCELKLHVRVPMDCWRQWIRHRTANVNEYSTRYSEAIDAAQHTSPGAWRKQSATNKQGSADTLDEAVGRYLSSRESELQKMAREVYEERLVKDVAREQARKDLPLSTYTEAYWKVDLHNLLHFLALRMDAHAQHEIRAYATVIGNDIVKAWCPITWEAFLDYRMEGSSLSRQEMEVVRRIAASDIQGACDYARSCGWLEMGKEGIRRNREREECEVKLVRLGLATPWRDSKSDLEEPS